MIRNVVFRDGVDLKKFTKSLAFVLGVQEPLIIDGSLSSGGGYSVYKPNNRFPLFSVYRMSEDKPFWWSKGTAYRKAQRDMSKESVRIEEGSMHVPKRAILAIKRAYHQAA